MDSDTAFYLSLFLIVYGLLVNWAGTFLANPYGKFLPTGEKAKAWGPHVSPLFGWIFMELPSLLLSAFCFFYYSTPSSSTSSSPPPSSLLLNQLCWGMFAFHYVVRSLIFPFLINRSAKPMPFVIPFFGNLFTSFNGYLQGDYLATHVVSASPIRLLIGVTLFVAGWLINQHSDHVLRSYTRKSNDDYMLPRGGAFEFVSAANYFGEIVEWFGFAIACGSPPAFAFAVFTLLFLGRRGIHQHQWYVKKFDTYPKDRKAIIPFLL